MARAATVATAKTVPGADHNRVMWRALQPSAERGAPAEEDGMETIGGFLVLSKRQPGFGEGGDVLIPPAAIVAVEPHRHGSYVYVSGHRWDVAHAHTEIMHAVDAARRAGTG